MKNLIFCLSLLSFSALARDPDTVKVTCSGQLGARQVVVSQEYFAHSGLMQADSRLTLSVDGKLLSDLVYPQANTLHVSAISKLIVLHLQNEGSEILVSVEYSGKNHRLNQMLVSGDWLGRPNQLIKLKRVSCQLL
jgi:hypothetical protein